ncbi:MAG: DUF5107 domain-containing protein [Sphaerochaeta sp.]
MITITKTTYQANAALVQGMNPLPSFRDPKHDLPVRLKDDVPQQYHRYLGLDCGRRALPYPMLDRYDRARTPSKLPAIVLDNEYLQATFLPSLGGRLISLFDKKEERELLYANKNLQVGNLGILDAWFAGGIEWNIGQYGHAFSSSLPLHFSSQKDKEGRTFLRLYSFERAKKLYFHIDFHLRNRYLVTHTAVHNPTIEDVSLYSWVNIAVESDDCLRVLASNSKALYLDPYAENNERLFGAMEMPTMPIYPGLDVSYPNRFAASNEYFFTCEEDELPWECALSRDGKGLFEVSTHPLSYRKMFCWGVHSGGERWQRYLSPDSNIDYVEIQSGTSPTQLHGEILKKKSSVAWTQAFGLLTVNPEIAHHKAYEVARKGSEEAILQKISVNTLSDYDAQLAEAALIPPGEILYRGEGWGYLETQIAPTASIPAFRFEAIDCKEPERVYLHFLQTGQLPPDIINLPLPPISLQWKERFEAALNESPERATLLYLLGIIYLEEERTSLAETVWREALTIHPSAFIARNLAQLEKRRGEVQAALAWYEKARDFVDFEHDWAIAEEYLALLVKEKKYEHALVVLNDLPNHWLEVSENLRLYRAHIAIWEKKPELIQQLVFDQPLAHIREGETPLEELWDEMCLLRYCEAHEVHVITASLREQIKTRYPIPPKYDFAMNRD